MKQESGITLIALVITIIVLLILAGVSLAMVAGGNGILTKAGIASESTPIADAKSNIGVEIADYIAKYYDAKYAKGLGGTTSVTGDTPGEYIASNLNTKDSGYYADGVTLKITDATKNVGYKLLTLSLDGTEKAYALLSVEDGSIKGNDWSTENPEKGA